MLVSQRATTTFMEKQMKNPKPDTSKSLSTTPTSKKSTKPPTQTLPPVYWISVNPLPDYEASFQQMNEAVEITKKQQNMI